MTNQSHYDRENLFYIHNFSKGMVSVIFPPVLLLQQGRRGYQHVEAHAIDGKLGCRISGQTVDRLSVMPWLVLPGGAQQAPLVDVLGSDLSTDDLQSGQIPAECSALFDETLLFDPTSVPVARAHPMSQHHWCRPWSPIELAWEVAWFPSPGAERDEASPSEEAGLARIRADFARLDVPGATSVWPLRAGHLCVTRARVIDGFGQFHDLGAAALAAPVRAEDLVSRAGPAFLAMPPRVQEPARLMFRLLDASDDTREATRERSPVCGRLVPDHMDEAIEIFEAAGQARGQLQPADDGRTHEWQGVPGQQDPLGAPAQLAQPQLAGFVQGLLAHGLRDRARRASPTPPTESALSALLRMIDATLWSTGPVGRAGNEHLSLLVHATCGFLPRKKIELLREHVAPALEALAFTFRVGPVLVDPETIRMPLPAEIAGGWSWVRRVNVTTWKEDPVVRASQDALLPDVPAILS